MNRKLLIGAGSAVAVAAFVLAAFGLNLIPLQPITETPPQQEKPEFHVFDIVSTEAGIDFKLQNLGNVSANQINVTFTLMWFGGTAEEYLPEINGTIVHILTLTKWIPKLEAKEVDEFFVSINAALEPYGGTLSYGVPIAQHMNQVNTRIVCREGVVETFVWTRP